MRNTWRSVVPVRLSDREREQIAAAAKLQQLTFSGFIRQAALQASAIVEGKVSVKAPEREAPEREPLGVVLLDDEPSAGDGEGDFPRPHHFEGEACSRCGLEISDVRGRDFPCTLETPGASNDEREMVMV